MRRTGQLLEVPFEGRLVKFLCGRASAALGFILLITLGVISPRDALSGTFVPTAPTEGIAYVTNGGNTDGDGSVSLIDIKSRAVVGAVPLAGYPLGVAVTPSRRSLLVSGFTSNNVTVLERKTLTTAATIPVCANPGQLAFIPHQPLAYVPCQGADVTDLIDTRSNTVVATVNLGANSIAVSPGAKFAYATDSSDDNVSVINIATNTVVKQIPLAGGLSGIAITPDGKLAIVEDLADISVIDTRTNKVSATVPDGGCGPAVAISHDGKFAYVTDYCDNLVSIVDTQHPRVVTTLTLDTPSGVAVSPDDESIYVVNNECPQFPCAGPGAVSIIDGKTDAVADTIAVGINPQFVAFVP